MSAPTPKRGRLARDKMRRARARVARAAWRAALGPSAGSAPLVTIRSIAEWSANAGFSARVAAVVPHWQAEHHEYPFPVDYPLWFHRSKSFDPKSAFVLRDMAVSPWSGMAWVPGGPILQETVGSLQRILGWGGVLHEPLQPITARMSQRLVAFGSAGYFHWLYEVLPAAVWALREFPDAILMVAADAPRYVLEAAEMLATDRCVMVDGVVRASELIVPGIEPMSGFVRSSDLHLVQELGATHSASPCPHVYVSRARDSKRSMRNEIELESELRERGFSILYSQETSWTDQISAFRGAELIVGPHGAGLANMVFSPRLRSVVELFPHDVGNDCYARAAFQLGSSYGWLACDPLDGEGASAIPVDTVMATVDGLLEAGD